MLPYVFFHATFFHEIPLPVNCALHRPPSPLTSRESEWTQLCRGGAAFVEPNSEFGNGSGYLLLANRATRPARAPTSAIDAESRSFHNAGNCQEHRRTFYATQRAQQWG